MVNQHPRSTSPKSDDDITQPQAPWTLVQKHPRYCSSWESGVIKINVAHSLAAEPKLKTYNLLDLRICRLGYVSADADRHHKLADFPDLLTALKAAINSLLFARTEMIDDCIVNLINYVVRLYGWMLNNNIFKLSQLVHDDLDRLSSQWKLGGWWYALRYEEHLSMALTLARSDSRVAAQLCGRNNSKWFTVDTDAICKITGLQIGASYLPAGFAVELANIVGAKNLDPRRSNRTTKITANIYRKLMATMNHLASFPVELGAIPFLPFLEISKSSETAFPSNKGRTKNISIENVVKLCSEAIKWVSQYKPIILMVAWAARMALEENLEKGITREQNVKEAVANAYAREVKRSGVEIADISYMTRTLLLKCMDALQTACFCLTAINHGRRREELIGKGLPYGLYFGCIREVDSVYDDWRIDIYVEKTSRAYCSFWCNALVRQAVSCLEEISQTIRPLGTPLKQYHAVQTEGRGDKLFRSRIFTKKGFENQAEGFDFSTRGAWFLTLADVDASYFRAKTHPFRRIHACLYMYRYDMPKVSALMQAMVHDSQSVTEVYYTDAPGVPPTDGVKALYGRGYDKDLVKLEAVTKEVASEYFGDVVLRLLRGEAVGGNFAKLALKLMHRISGSAKFQDLEFEKKAEVISEGLKRRGYSASPKEHGICCATETSKTKLRSNCAIEGDIHQENATPKTCSSCVHLSTTGSYREGLKNSLVTLQAQTVDFSLPPAVRYRITQDCEDLKAYIAADENSSQENQRLVANLTEKWNKIFMTMEE